MGQAGICTLHWIYVALKIYRLLNTNQQTFTLTTLYLRSRPLSYSFAVRILPPLPHVLTF
jgi:hypothetical protein